MQKQFRHPRCWLLLAYFKLKWSFIFRCVETCSRTCGTKSSWKWSTFIARTDQQTKEKSLSDISKQMLLVSFGFGGAWSKSYSDYRTFHRKFELESAEEVPTGQRLTDNLAIFCFVWFWFFSIGPILFRYTAPAEMISITWFCPDLNVMCRFYLLKLAAHLKSKKELIENFVSLPNLRLDFQDRPNDDLCPTPWGPRWCSSPTGPTTRTTTVLMFFIPIFLNVKVTSKEPLCKHFFNM